MQTAVAEATQVGDERVRFLRENPEDRENETAQLAVERAASALGARIL